jgi:hypothetical protein
MTATRARKAGTQLHEAGSEDALRTLGLDTFRIGGLSPNAPHAAQAANHNWP